VNVAGSRVVFAETEPALEMSVTIVVSPFRKVVSATFAARSVQKRQ
jgi:hypothetical protein